MHNLQNYKRENVINAKSLLPKLNLVQEEIIMDKPRHKFVIMLYSIFDDFRIYFK
ncbi:hypothetical protein HMPREF1573_00467 [Gardnerella vaginalis JCP7276]|nr:hypothetical protein CGSMWGv75712_03700 [Gardnerella vaginalis 75712]EPI53789.1 hypothetical protein HMPREF1575_00150 [Gardnerella vaginalis JCP7672]EPI57035.1 hypothetical protein HMPREF1573_00467 [Gardnerella vaginalis JCP7276]PNP88035.1 hypothetical protein BFS12_03000 [Gardnerella vaginalis]